MIRFYSPQIESLAELPEQESTHCCRVLRMKAGDVINVVDGNGHEFVCEISDPHPRHTSLNIIEVHDEPLHWNPYITLAVAPTKNIDRMEWLAEKAVEIGVNRLVFVECEHNVRRVVKRERIEKILISAMKQSLKSTLPLFDEMMPLETFLKEDKSAMKFMGYCNPEIERRDFANVYDGVSDVSILIGPEGDFSTSEVELAINSGVCPVTFGNTRLRTETAGLYALCATHTLISMK